MTSPKSLVYNNILYPMFNTINLLDNIYNKDYTLPHKLDSNPRPFKRRVIQIEYPRHHRARLWKKTK